MDKSKIEAAIVVRERQIAILNAEISHFKNKLAKMKFGKDPSALYDNRKYPDWWKQPIHIKRVFGYTF